MRASPRQEVGFFAASKLLVAWPGAFFALERGPATDFDKGLTRAFNGLAPHMKGLMDVLIGPSRAMGALIGLQQNSSPRELAGSSFPCGNQDQEVLPFFMG
jgi:hypothetical protein